MTTAFDHGGTVFAVARVLGIPPEEILDFSASINPLGPVPAVREAVAAAFDRLVHYPDSEATELKERLAEFHGLAPENITVANGSTELIYLAPRLVAGHRGLIVAPPFSEYGKSLSRNGWEYDYLNLSPANGFALDTEALAERLRFGYDLLFLCNPGNPTGRLYPRAEIEAACRLCDEFGTFLVLDEAFMDFCEGESAKGLVAGWNGGVVLRSMTKFFGLPGLRLGYAIGAPEVSGAIAALREPWSVNTPAQVAGIASLADGEYRRRTHAYVERERELLAAGLAVLPGLTVYPSSANYLLVEITTGPDAPELARRLLLQRILIRDCSSFVGLGSRFFRVAVRTTEENRRLLESLGQLFF
jgi:threonine-phosphate decarboxylase